MRLITSARPPIGTERRAQGGIRVIRRWLHRYRLRRAMRRVPPMKHADQDTTQETKRRELAREVAEQIG